MCSRSDLMIRAIDANNKMVETSRKNSTLIITQAFDCYSSTKPLRKGRIPFYLTILIFKTTALTLQKEELMKMQDEIGHYTEMTSHIFQTHTDHEMVALGNLLPTELKATLKKVGNVFLTPIQSSDVHMFLPTDSLIKELV